MNSRNSEISLYVDTLIVNTILEDDHLSKQAQASGALSSIIGKVKDYFGEHVNPNDKAGSFLDMIAPGVITMTFRALGLGKIGLLFGLAASVFHIDVAGILKSIYDKIKSALSGGKGMSSPQVEGMVSSSVQENDQQKADDGLNKFELLQEARMLKLALTIYEAEMLNKKGIKLSYLLPKFAATRSSHLSLLTTVLSWIFKTALASAGLMVAGDAINALLGRPSAFTGTIQHGKPVEQQTQTVPEHVSTQTKFKVNPSYQDSKMPNNWAEQITNNSSSIADMLIKFAKEVYGGLNGLESTMVTTSGFQNVLETIVWYNHSSAGDPIVFIPKNFTSKKQIVDNFIDDVAQKAP